MRHGAFSLVELLVCVAIIAILVGVGLPVWAGARSSVAATKCAGTLRSLGQAFSQYSIDNEGRFPRSWHSAAANREPGWARSVAPYLGASGEQIENDWPNVFNELFRSAADTNRSEFIYSYAMNVFFELDPAGDDYAGAPQTWRRGIQVPHPGRTVLLAQGRPVQYGDHVMCHQWATTNSAKNALNHGIHGGRANYLFVDGHVEKLEVGDTFLPSRKINRWNPSLAGANPR